MAVTLTRNVLCRLTPSLLAVWGELGNLNCFSFLTIDNQSAGYGELYFSDLSSGAGSCHGSVETGTVFPADLPDDKGSQIYSQRSTAAFIQSPALVI